MTTYRQTLELDDTEFIALRAALAVLQVECNLHIENKQAAPWTAYLRSIDLIQTKIATGAQQTSGNTC